MTHRKRVSEEQVRKGSEALMAKRTGVSLEAYRKHGYSAAGEQWQDDCANARAVLEATAEKVTVTMKYMSGWWVYQNEAGDFFDMRKDQFNELYEPINEGE